MDVGYFKTQNGFLDPVLMQEWCKRLTVFFFLVVKLLTNEESSYPTDVWFPSPGLAGCISFLVTSSTAQSNYMNEGFCWAFPDKVFPFAWPTEKKKRCFTSWVIVFAYNFHSPSENSLYGYYKIIKKTMTLCRYH